MNNILPHILGGHDPVRLCYALLICWASSLAAVAVLAHLRQPQMRRRWLWLASAAACAGFGIWATHFVAMLGYHGEGAIGFRADLTIASLGLIVAGLFGAFTGAMASRSNARRSAFGALAGLAISAMHYVGMAGFVRDVHVEWNYWLVSTSIIAGLALGALAFVAISRAEDLRSRFTAASLLAVTTLAVHFIGMAAYSSGSAHHHMQAAAVVSPGALDFAIIASTLFMVAMTYVGVGLHGRDHAQRQEMRHMAELANATIEALLICDGTTVTAANENFLHLTGQAEAQIIGSDVSAFLSVSQDSRSALMSGTALELALRTLDGPTIDVEVHARRVVYGGRQQTALAILDIRKRKEAEHEILHLANYDVLTQLPNRNCFYRFLREEIERATVTDSRLALICIDLDHFKQINDLFGHKVGDEFLQRATAVMKSVLKDGQVLGRVGGDEFALLLPDIGIPENAGKLAEDMLAAFARNNAEVGKSINLSGSLGIGIFPDDAQSKIDLLTAADTAMYKAKREGRNTFRFFDTGMAADMRERRLLEQELRCAIENGEFSLVYQPQADCSTGQIFGMEALLRWQSPTRGEVPPTTFIAIAEECGEIGRIGDWVLERACRDAASWRDRLTVAVNVSSVQLINHAFTHRLHEILLQTGLPADRLEIEITETALVQDFQRALNTLRRIKALGVRIAMDDFGTGYSSLYNLRSFPFDKIKIDGSFINRVHSDEQSAAIVRAVIGLGKGLGLPILAEGVETKEEMDFLREAGCTEVQGYVIGRPATYGDQAPPRQDMGVARSDETKNTRAA